MYERKDHFYKKAKKEGHLSRAIYKLEEIQKKFGILKKGDAVLELGSAPGGWLEFLAKTVGPQGKIVGIDRLPLAFKPPAHIFFFQKKFEEVTVEELPVKKFDVVLSDLSPDLSGITLTDQQRSFELVQLVWEWAQKFLKPNGHLVMKIFPGEEADRFTAVLKKNFQRFVRFVPEATRKSSSEVYFVALRFQGAPDKEKTL